MRDQPDNKMASEPEVKGVDTEPTEVPDWGLDENGFMTEEYLATVPVKGPDSEVWGHDDDRPANAEAIQGPQPQYHEETGEEIEVKGPDPKVWGDSAADQ